VKIELKETVEPEIETEPLPMEPSGNQFIVENVGMLYASWSDTVIIDRGILSDWGRKIKEVEIETVSGKRMQCKVKPTDGLKRGIVQIPDKMQLNLRIRKGELVTVKPVARTRIYISISQAQSFFGTNEHNELIVRLINDDEAGERARYLSGF